MKARLLPALGEGFRLIGRAPLAVIVWGLISIAAAAIPAAMMWGGSTDLVDYYANLATSVGRDDPVPSPPTFGPVYALAQALQYILSILTGALIYTAVYRAVLRPQDKGFAYLRFSSDEFHVGLVMVVLVVLSGILVAVGLLIALIPAVVLALAAGGAAPGAAFVFVFIILALLGALVLFTRLGLALPMSFAERKIRIFEAWGFSKGYGWQLLGMGLLQVLIFIGLYVAAFAVIIGVAAGSFVTLDPAAIEGALQAPDVLSRFMPAIIAAGLFYLVLIVVMTPIALAPWAKAYQLIAEAREGGKAAVFS